MATDAPPSFPKQSGGTPSKKKVLIVGGIAVGGGLLGILYFRRKGTANTSATSVTDPNAIDPNTGVPYAQEGMYASGVGTTPGALGTYNPLTGQYTPGTATTPNVTVPASNAQWAQAAEAALVAEGFDPVATATAIGRYLQGAPVTSDQYDIVTAALGLENQPPGGAPPVVQQVAQGNNNTQTTPAPQPAPPAQEPAPSAQQFFTVQPWSYGNVANSTVSGIAQQFGISQAQLLALNPSITNPNLIHVGDQIRVR